MVGADPSAPRNQELKPIASDSLEVKMEEKKFILWDPGHGAPRRDSDGNIDSEGLIGRITEGNAYLSAYASYPDARRPADLEVGEKIDQVSYSLSGSYGVYTVYRVS